MAFWRGDLMLVSASFSTPLGVLGVLFSLVLYRFHVTTTQLAPQVAQPVLLVCVAFVRQKREKKLFCLFGLPACMFWLVMCVVLLAA